MNHAIVAAILFSSFFGCARSGLNDSSETMKENGNQRRAGAISVNSAPSFPIGLLENGGNFCTATLVNYEGNLYALSAGHCVSDGGNALTIRWDVPVEAAQCGAGKSDEGKLECSVAKGATTRAFVKTKKDLQPQGIDFAVLTLEAIDGNFERLRSKALDLGYTKRQGLDSRKNLTDQLMNATKAVSRVFEQSVPKRLTAAFFRPRSEGSPLMYMDISDGCAISRLSSLESEKDSMIWGRIDHQCSISPTGSGALLYQADTSSASQNQYTVLGIHYGENTSLNFASAIEWVFDALK